MMKKIFSIFILILCFFCLISVWPICLLRQDLSLSSGDTEAYSKTPYLKDGDSLSQAFIAQNSYLKELSFSFKVEDSLSDDTSVIFILTDDKQSVLSSATITASALNESGYCTIPICKWLKKGSVYTYTISIIGNKNDCMTMYCTPNESNYAPGNIRLSMNQEDLDGQAYNLYLYTEPLHKKAVLCVWAFILLISSSLFALVKTDIRNRFFSKKDVCQN